MRADDTWLVVDTETSGLTNPIYIVEIAAQRMRGWQREGEMFQVLLNHDVPIDPAAESVHGYSREYLRAHGLPPLEAHAQFNDYAGNRPIVAYNIGFDWDRALLPEYQRLGCPVSGRKGFCAMTLSRRTIPGVPNYKLDTLKQHFALNSNRSHRGRNDVETLCELFEQTIAPKLYTAGIIGFDQIAEFSRKTPVATCLEQITGVGEAVWYILDENSKAQGPYTTAIIRSCAGETGCYVWREGMTEWAFSGDLPEFAISFTPKIQRKRRKKDISVPKQVEKQQLHNDNPARWITELTAICKEIMADGVVSETEFYALHTWLTSCPCSHIYPISVLTEQVEVILLDGIITSEELEDLKRSIAIFFPESLQDKPTSQPSDEVLLNTSACYRFVDLKQGTQEWLEWRNAGIGASDAPTIMGENPWKSADQLFWEKRGVARGARPNAAMARGTALEPEARKRFIERFGVKVHPACLQSCQYDWLRASVDGISDDGALLVEIKCGESVYRRTQEEQCVPDYYYGQLQHMLAVTGLQSIYFFCYLPGRDEIMLNVERNDSYIERLICIEFDFWQKILG